MSFKNFKKGPILITGSRGMLGSDLVQELSDRWGTSSIVATDHNTLDITDAVQVEYFLKSQPASVIINAAAYTDVDGAETDREKAYSVNAIGPRNLTEIAHKRGVPVVHFSTDYVFDGNQNRPFTEEDLPFPAKPNYYGETKLIGELAVLKNPMNLVLRVQWLYGNQRERFSVLKEKETFTPFDDQWGAPTWTRDVSRIVMDLIETDAKGLFHFAYDDFATWFDVYSFVKNELNLKTQLIPKKVSDINLPARRPKYGVLSNKKLLSHLGRQSVGSWKTSLKEFLNQLKK